MKYRTLLIGLVVSLAGCAVHAPLMVELSNGDEELRGEAVATLVSGVFEVSNSKGLKCNGTYDQYTRTPLLKVQAKCNDGRSGTVEILRHGQNLENGVGIGVMNDGTKIRISMGINVYSHDVNKTFLQK